MLEGFDPNRYSVIDRKNKREIIMLRGRGCSWRRCRFCDYHLDCDPSDEENFLLNQAEIKKVTGVHHKLEVINSGTFVDLDAATMDLIQLTCVAKDIRELHFESHWNHREEIAGLRRRFADDGIAVKVKIGVETFDPLFRECYLQKGMGDAAPQEIARFFDECCLLQGIPGQTEASMLRDIATGLQWFERVCVNIMQENGMPVKPDPAVIEVFSKRVAPIYCEDPRVDILMENTAFGVGGVTTQ